MRREGLPAGKNSWRLSAIRIVFLLVALILIGRLFVLQIAQYQSYAALAAIRHDISSVLVPERGAILVNDKNESGGSAASYYPVATNRKAQNLVVSPKDIPVEKEVEVANVLAGITGLDAKKIGEVLAQKEKRYWVVKKDLTETEVEAIAKAKSQESPDSVRLLPKLGVWFEEEVKRYYPEGEFLSHTLGFLGYVGDGKAGIYGLESKFNELLTGRPGRLEAAADAGGRLISNSFRKLVPAENGSNLVLTIDRSIQAEAQRVLKDYVNRFSAEGGSVVIADPKTGAILALASEPSFNVNEFNKVKDPNIFDNPAVQARYEPGSIIKPLTMAAGLDSGKINVDDTYEDTGAAVYGSHVIRNSDQKAHGVQTMTQILEKSLNTGVVHVQKKMGGNILQRYFKKFGLDEKTDITLPGEISGDLRNMDGGQEIAYATASFGQGVSVTPLELVQAYTAIATNGETKKLHIISEIQHPDGSREVVEPQIARRVISPETAAAVRGMLIQVVENGHGKRAGVKGYYLAGKTGTAQIPLVDRAGYDPDKTIGSFIGFGPVEDPRFVMLVKIDKPVGVRFAESTAAPAFGEIAKFILNYLQVPPIRLVE